MPVKEFQKPRGATSFYDFSGLDGTPRPVNSGSVAAGGTPSAPAASPVSSGGSSDDFRPDEDMVFTEEGLERGISIGTAKRLAGIPASEGSPALAPSAGAPPPSPKDAAKSGGSGYDDVYNYIKSRMSELEPSETKEDRVKRERREKRARFLSGIADVLGAMHRAYSYQRGVAPMSLPDVSGKTRERIERARSERDRNLDRGMNYSLALARLEDSKANADWQRGYRDEQLAQRKAEAEARKAAQEEKNRIEGLKADAYVKAQESKAKNDDARAAYYTTLGEQLELGYPLKVAEAKARIAEREARTDKLRGSVNGNASGGRKSSGGRRSDDSGTEKVTEKTDYNGNKTTTVTYKRPRSNGGGSGGNGRTNSSAKSKFSIYK